MKKLLLLFNLPLFCIPLSGAIYMYPLGNTSTTTSGSVDTNSAIAFASDIGIDGNLTVVGTITANGTFSADALQITGLLPGPVWMNSSTQLVNIPFPITTNTFTWGTNMVATTNAEGVVTVHSTATGSSSGLPDLIPYPGAQLSIVGGVAGWRDPSLFSVFEGYDKFASATYTTEGGLGVTTGPAYALYGNGNALGAARGFRNDFLALKIAPTNATTPMVKYAHGLHTPQHIWNTNFFYEVDFLLFGLGYSTVTNAWLAMGLLSTTTSTNVAGVMWKADTQLTNAAVATCIGTTSAFWTNTFQVTNIWQRLGFYGSTNSVVFTTNGVPCWTNSDSSTLSGGVALTAAEVLAQSIAWPDVTGNSSSTNIQVYFDTKKCFEY